MNSLTKKMPRRTVVQAMIALPALSLLRALPADASPVDRPHADPNEIVQVNGWILRRGDLA